MVGTWELGIDLSVGQLVSENSWISFSFSV